MRMSKGVPEVAAPSVVGGSVSEEAGAAVVVQPSTVDWMEDMMLENMVVTSVGSAVLDGAASVTSGSMVVGTWLLDSTGSVVVGCSPPVDDTSSV